MTIFAAKIFSTSMITLSDLFRRIVNGLNSSQRGANPILLPAVCQRSWAVLLHANCPQMLSKCFYKGAVTHGRQLHQEGRTAATTLVMGFCAGAVAQSEAQEAQDGSKAQREADWHVRLPGEVGSAVGAPTISPWTAAESECVSSTFTWQTSFLHCSVIEYLFHCLPSGIVTLLGAEKHLRTGCGLGREGDQGLQICSVHRDCPKSHLYCRSLLRDWV